MGTRDMRWIRPGNVVQEFAEVGGLRLRTLGAPRRDEAGEIWRGLEARFGEGGLACSWTWTEAWLRHFGDLVPHRFVVAERDDPRGIALVVRGVGPRRGGVPIRTLHLGTAGEPDAHTVRVQYNRVLVARADRGAFATALLRLLRDEGGWDELRLDGFAPDDAAPFVDQDSAFTVVRRPSRLTELASLRAAGRSVLEGLDGGAAKKIRRSIRLIEQAHGPISVEWATSIAEARRIFAEMVALHEQRWRAEGDPGAFASPRFTAFHRDLVEALFPRGGVLLARVRAGETTLGCDYSFIERNRVLGYQWGVARLPDQRPSPGLVTGAMVMQAALERGLDEYDWLSGEVFYKRQLTTAARELIWARTSRGARIRAVYALERAVRTLHRGGVSLPLSA